MTLKARFSLIAFGIAVFVIATPILVLYARGFQYDFAEKKIVKTGTLVVRTEPDNADVYLDNKKQPGHTPKSVRFLLPKDYDVRIEKNGYQSWSKRLDVNSQLVTWANESRDFITLFLSEPTLDNTSLAQSPMISKDGNQIVFTEDGKYKFLNVSSGAITTLGPVADISFPAAIPPVPFQWQDASKIFEMLLSKNTVPIPDKQLKETKYAESDGLRTIFLFGADLYTYDLTQTQLLDKNVSGATLAPDGVWYVQNDQLRHFDYDNGTTTTILGNLPLAQSVQILRVENKIFLTLDKTLYVVNDKLERIYAPVTFTKWDQASRQLLFGNPNEIQIYSPDKKTTSLVVRTITGVTQPILNWETGFVFFGNEGQIKAAELDDRDHRNVYTIISEAGPNPVFSLSPDGKNLYLFNSQGAKTFTIR